MRQAKTDNDKQRRAKTSGDKQRQADKRRQAETSGDKQRHTCLVREADRPHLEAGHLVVKGKLHVVAKRVEEERGAIPGTCC